MVALFMQILNLDADTADKYMGYIIQGSICFILLLSIMIGLGLYRLWRYIIKY